MYICGEREIIGINANSFSAGMMNKLHSLGCSVQSGLGAAEKSPCLQLLINLQDVKKLPALFSARGSQCSETTCPNLLLNRTRFRPHHIVCGVLFTTHLPQTLEPVFIRKPFVRPSETAFCIHDYFHSDDCFHFFVGVLFLQGSF